MKNTNLASNRYIGGNIKILEEKLKLPWTNRKNK